MAEDEDEDTHLLFVDDSGTKEYSATGVYDPSGNTRHFVFAGLLLTVEEERRITAELRRVKKDVFRIDTVEIKSNWLRLEHECEARYLRKFNLAKDALSTFVDRYYQVVLGGDLKLIACVVDKVHMREDYGDHAWYPPAAAYELLLQRAEAEIEECGPGRCFSVVVDDMTGATPKGNQYRTNLRRHHAQLKQTGSYLYRGIRFPHLRDVRFVDSKRSELIQVADLVAYNVYRQFRDHGEAWEQVGLHTLPCYDWFARILPKFRTGPDGRIQGFGVGKIPLRTRVPWRI
jgi:Protein of unknown function (DUF3800)